MIDTNEMRQEARVMEGEGYWSGDTLQKAADEIERVYAFVRWCLTERPGDKELTTKAAEILGKV